MSNHCYRFIKKINIAKSVTAGLKKNKPHQKKHTLEKGLTKKIFKTSLTKESK